MTLQQALSNAHEQFSAMLRKDKNMRIIALPFPEYTINCLVLYKDRINNEILADNAPLSLLFSQIGVLDEADPFILLVHSYYLARHAQDELRPVSAPQ